MYDTVLHRVGLVDYVLKHIHRSRENGQPHVTVGRVNKDIVYRPHFDCLLIKQNDNLHLEINTVEPLNNGHIWDECFVHCLEVVPSPEVEMYGQ